ncbi:hypothetical protein PoB_004495300 [Plakobranchus ocellatus]|uniref:Uncharacterized protein n=1 Tax=Plakobranchus ocellatus TaxID=259542 RepID=A0AAV4BI05_9GAST|nr:hypothetical protein PoB_004495300 [Plakobranchus ocellatus]
MSTCKPHPKFLTLLSPPSDEQLNLLDANRISQTFEPAITTNGMDLRFQSSWDDWLVDVVYGPLQLEEITKDVQLDWFLSQSPEIPDVGPLHQHQGRAPSPYLPQLVPYDDGVNEVQWIDPFEVETITPQSELLYQNQMADPTNQQWALQEPSPTPKEIPLVPVEEPPPPPKTDQQQEPSEEDKIILQLFEDEPISKRLSVCSQPFHPPSIPKTVAYLPAIEFGYTGDMQLIHEACSKDYGTTLKFIADSNTSKRVHLMTVKIPPIIKCHQKIKSMEMNVTQHLYILQHNNDTYVRTITGVQTMPTLPAFYTETISEQEEEQLAQLFIMLANLPYSCTPYYKLFIPNGAIRPMNIIQWPAHELLQTEEVSILANAAKNSMLQWLLAHRNGDSNAPDDESQDLASLPEDRNCSNNNNRDNDNDDDDEHQKRCFPPLKTLKFARSLIKGIKTIIVLTDMMLNLLEMYQTP